MNGQNDLNIEYLVYDFSANKTHYYAFLMFIQTVLVYRFSIEHSKTDIRAISVLNIPVIYKYIILI